MQCILLCVCVPYSPTPACSHLNSLLKYHRCYHVSLSAFQDIYTSILSLQDELEEDTDGENGGTALENCSQNWQVCMAFGEL